MFKADLFFRESLEKRRASGLLRSWGIIPDTTKVDFFSNDYLGLARREETRKELSEILLNNPQLLNGSTGSRLVSGQSEELENLEALCLHFFKGESAIFLPSGYTANLALLSSVPTRHDTIIYDEQVHVSLKDGIRLSLAQKLSFKHNDLEDLKLKKRKAKGRVFVVVESIYSMDGDTCPIQEIAALAENWEAHLIVDEAHSTGTYGLLGQGLCLAKEVENKVWARVYTFGKALGAAGAVLILTNDTKQYLMNTAHPIIYSTAPLPLQVCEATLQLKALISNPTPVSHLKIIIDSWCQLTPHFSGLSVSANPDSPVQHVVCPGNHNARNLADQLKASGFQVKAMLSPTIRQGSERLRISLHSFNTPSEISRLVEECWTLRK